MALALFVILMGAGFVEQADAATFTVGTNSDPRGSCTPTSSSSCSLRQIINYENGLATTPNPVDEIVVPADSYSLTNGALVVNQSVIIAGAGARTTNIYQQTTSATSRVFDISASIPAHVVTISGLSVFFGKADSTNGSYGGDIRNQGTLSLSNDQIANGSTTAGSGGGIANDGGHLTVTDSLVTTNMSTSVSGSGGDSGGIANIGATQAAQLVIDNSTITNNTGDEGGGLMSWGNAANTVQISDSTIVGNTDTGVRTSQVNSGGLLSYGGGQISVHNSIVALNTLGTTSSTTVDCATGPSDTITSGGYNIESGTDCGFAATGDHHNTDPGFITGSPQDLGGNTDVIALQATSPAVDAIPTGAPGCSGTDQRGTSRPQGSGCDIGAYELFQGIEGQSLTTLVGAVGTNGTIPTIDWGDGTPASISSYDSSTGRVTGTHTFAEEGRYSGTIHYFNSDGSPSTQAFAIKLQDAPLTGTASPPNAGAGAPFTGPVATFTDADPAGTASDYTATIDWGDGTTTAGTVAAGTAGFTVTGTHTYPTGGHDNLTIVITDSGGAKTTVNEVANVAPTVSGVSPSSGPAGGGTSVTLTGAGFSGATAVRFGSAAAGSFTVNSDTQITATSPAGSGTVDVTVTTPGGTSPTGSADRFAYVPVAPVLLSSSVPVVQGSSGAAFVGVVDPEGLLTSAHFEYGLDPKYSGGGPVVYDGSTLGQVVGSDFGGHGVSAVVSGLVPNALYHVRLVASNSAGTVFAPDETFVTGRDPVPSVPVIARSANLVLVSGLVLIRAPQGSKLGAARASAAGGLVKGQGFVPLTEARQVPIGSEIDARRGTLDVVVASGHARRTQRARLAGAVFASSQARTGPLKGLTTFGLLEGAFSGAPSYRSCGARTAVVGSSVAAQAARLSPSVLQTLRASDHGGRFRTRGRYSAATVRGTIWDTVDRCDGTLTVVKRGSVGVLDFARRKTITVRAGHSYLAKALQPRRRAR
jgi:hypothetical protein